MLPPTILSRELSDLENLALMQISFGAKKGCPSQKTAATLKLDQGKRQSDS
jgi:hypothetical protein